MIRTLLYDHKTYKSRWGDAGLIAEWADNPDLWIWADFSDEEPGEESRLFHEAFGLHPLVIADAQRDRHPPKLEGFDEYFFLLIHGLGAATPDTDYHTIQIAFFVSERFLVTRRKAESVSIDAVWNEAGDGKLDVARGSAHVLYRILRRVTDRYTSLIEGLERRLDVMEDEMFQNPRDALLEELLGFGRNLKKLQRVFNYHQGLFALLGRKDHSFIGQQERHEFIDVFEHTERLASLTTLYRDLADDLMNGYLSAPDADGRHLRYEFRVYTRVEDQIRLLHHAWRDGYDRHRIVAYIPEDAVALNGLLTPGSMGAMRGMDMRTGVSQ